MKYFSGFVLFIFFTVSHSHFQEVYIPQIRSTQMLPIWVPSTQTDRIFCNGYGGKLHIVLEYYYVSYMLSSFIINFQKCHSLIYWTTVFQDN